MADMTNKEAIEIITRNRDGLKKAEGAGLLTIKPCLYEAFEVAINDLESISALSADIKAVDRDNMDEKVLIGFNMALALFNKHFGKE